MKKKISIPVPRRDKIAKVPVIMQYENLECGAVSLAMILGYYGKWIAPGMVRADTGPCRDGANAENIAKAARSYQLDADVQRLDAAAFLEKATFPCIVHWEYVHFLVVTGMRRGKVYVNDPKGGNYAVTMGDFSKKFSGFCVFFRPGTDFTPSGHRKTLRKSIVQRLQGAKLSLLFVLLVTLLTSLLTLAEQGMNRVYMDRLIRGLDAAWVRPFLILFTLIASAHIVLGLMQAYYMLRINGKMAISDNAAYMEHLLRLPIRFFTQRLPGDINIRRDMNTQISESLVQTFGPLFLQALMMILYLTVMLSYSPFLALIGVSGVALNALMNRYITRKRSNILRRQLSETGQLTGILAAGIQTIETIKASGAENGFFELWSGYQANVVASQVQFSTISQVLGAIPALITQLSGSIVLMAGVYLIIHQRFTPGMLLAFQGILNLFNQPATQLVNASKDMQEMRTKMERIDDVMEAPADPMWKDEPVRDAMSYDKLSGQLSMKDVSFGYSRLDPPLISGFNLELKPGRSVAFVGPSGCGKSTLAKLISGLCLPWTGEISFDATPLRELETAVLRGSLAVVDQDITLFEDTIANNIGMWDHTIENFEIRLAARDAQIHQDILKRDRGYQHVLLPEGKDFSGGQRQRMEIARVLAQDPTIIILDEATSALDARTEYDVVRSIRDRGITCIVIAHRLSTIRDCDEIIVLDHGKVMERGSHNELLRLNGLYSSLIQSE